MAGAQRRGVAKARRPPNARPARTAPPAMGVVALEEASVRARGWVGDAVLEVVARHAYVARGGWAAAAEGGNKTALPLLPASLVADIGLVVPCSRDAAALVERRLATAAGPVAPLKASALAAKATLGDAWLEGGSGAYGACVAAAGPLVVAALADARAKDERKLEGGSGAQESDPVGDPYAPLDAVPPALPPTLVHGTPLWLRAWLGEACVALALRAWYHRRYGDSEQLADYAAWSRHLAKARVANRGASAAPERYREHGPRGARAWVGDGWLAAPGDAEANDAAAFAVAGEALRRGGVKPAWGIPLVPPGLRVPRSLGELTDVRLPIHTPDVSGLDAL